MKFDSRGQSALLAPKWGADEAADDLTASGAAFRQEQGRLGIHMPHD